MARVPSILRRFAVLGAAFALAAAAAAATPALNPRSAARASGSCDLQSAGDKIHHVIYVQFDNTHFKRDDPNVPSVLK